jgi:hypothetical protein
MHVVRFADAPEYSAPGHNCMAMGVCRDGRPVPPLTSGSASR